MTLIKWTPINSLNRDFDHMLNRIFNDGWNFSALNHNQSPAVDIVEDKDKFVLSADFPGIEKKNINLIVEDGVLKMVGSVEIPQEAFLSILEVGSS